MRFLVDECVGTSVYNWLRSESHDVFSVFDEWRGATDDKILEKCYQENYILITSDKDFGEMIFRKYNKHRGIILIRCEPNIFIKKIEVLDALLKEYAEKITNNFVVVTSQSVRITKM